MATVDETAGQDDRPRRGRDHALVFEQVLYATHDVRLIRMRFAGGSTRSSSRKNYIDDLVLAKVEEPESRAVGRGPRMRRSFAARYLDAAGILPTAKKWKQFLADKSPDKRSKLIDRLLDREEYVDYWAYKWSDLLLVSSRKLRPTAMRAFYNWIRDSVKENKPWDKFARDIFTAPAVSRQNGALNYFVLHKDPIELTENVTQAFLGQRLTCARCHNHPLEKWTQKQYYQMANLFSRVGVKNGDDPVETIMFAKASGDINHPRLLRPLQPTPLDGKPMALDLDGGPPRALRQLAHQPEERDVRA